MIQVSQKIKFFNCGTPIRKKSTEKKLQAIEPGNYKDVNGTEPFFQFGMFGSISRWIFMEMIWNLYPQSIIGQRIQRIHFVKSKIYKYASKSIAF